MKDQLSALMDGEFDIESSQHLITSVKSGSELKSCWTHYHLIGDTLRGDIGRGGIQMSQGFSARVMGALESEPTMFLPNLSSSLPNLSSTSTPSIDAASRAHAKPSAKPSFYTNSTKFWSVAASVAAVMFVGVMVLQQQLSQPEALAPVEIAQSVPTEYLQAHQAAAPSNAAYYIQSANYKEPKQ